MQPAVDTKWVWLQTDGDTGNELLLEEPDSDGKAEQKSIENAVQRPESARDKENFLWWIRWAWNDVSICNALWDDMRPHVLIVALCGSTCLHMLAGLAALSGCNALQALLISLKHFTAATLSAGVFSMATRFLTLMADKAAAVKKTEVFSMVQCVPLTNALAILPAAFTCIYEVGAGVMVFHEARAEEDFQWFLQLLADMARVLGFAAAIVLSTKLVFLMKTDVVAMDRAMKCHYGWMEEYAKLEAWRTQKRREPPEQPDIQMVAVVLVGIGVAFAICIEILIIPVWISVYLERPHSATSGNT